MKLIRPPASEGTKNAKMNRHTLSFKHIIVVEHQKVTMLDIKYHGTEHKMGHFSLEIVTQDYNFTELGGRVHFNINK